MAPIRKNSVVAVEPKWCSISVLTTTAFSSPIASGRYNSGANMNSVHVATNISSATAALFTFVRLSMAMQK